MAYAKTGKHIKTVKGNGDSKYINLADRGAIKNKSEVVNNNKVHESEVQYGNVRPTIKYVHRPRAGFLEKQHILHLFQKKYQL